MDEMNFDFLNDSEDDEFLLANTGNEEEGEKEADSSIEDFSGFDFLADEEDEDEEEEFEDEEETDDFLEDELDPSEINRIEIDVNSYDKLVQNVNSFNEKFDEETKSSDAGESLDADNEDDNDDEESLSAIDSILNDEINQDILDNNERVFAELNRMSQQVENNGFIQQQDNLDKKAEALAFTSEFFKNNGGDASQKTTFGLPSETNPLVVKRTPGKVNNYLVITDLHLWWKNLESRKGYVDECWEYLTAIECYIISRTEINNIIFTGDIFHQGFNNLDNSRNFKLFFKSLANRLEKRGGHIYSVIGNHEYTYSTNSLFWYLEDDVFKTPTDIYDNGIHIALDSFPSRKSTRPYREKIEADICITHTDVMPPEVKKEVETSSNRKVYMSKLSTGFERFKVKHLFIGHAHQVCETYIAQDKDTGLQMEVDYLGSIGRTNVKEVDDNFLERTLPLIKIKDGSFEIERLPLNLRNYESTVIATEVAKNKEKYENRKIFEEVKLAKVNEDPLGDIKRTFNDPLMNDIIDSASDGILYGELKDIYHELRTVAMNDI